MSLAWLTEPVTQVWGMPLSWGDLSGFATGIACVALTVRAHLWNFPMGILNSLILGVVFLDQRLFSDASLQILFVVLSIHGWVVWVRGGPAQDEVLPVVRAGRDEQIALVVVTALAWFALWRLMILVKGAAPPIDALITSLSLSAQWLLNRKRLDNWWWWIVVDGVSIPLYAYRGLPLIALLYACFLAMCVSGWISWRKVLVR